MEYPKIVCLFFLSCIRRRDPATATRFDWLLLRYRGLRARLWRSLYPRLWSRHRYAIHVGCTHGRDPTTSPPRIRGLIRKFVFPLMAPFACFASPPRIRGLIHDNAHKCQDANRFASPPRIRGLILVLDELHQPFHNASPRRLELED